MRYRILASFQGAPYEAGIGPTESDVVLFAACPPPEALKFEPATGHWRKQVERGQVQALYESRPVGMFRGERCVVLDDLGDRLHIVYLGHDALRAAQIGYWEVDRGVFELITPRHEVTDIVEQRLPLPVRSNSGQHTRPGPIPPDRPNDYGIGTGNGVPYSGTDSPSYGHGTGGRQEFGTGPQAFDQRASLGGPPPTTSQDLPISGLGRADPRSADQSDVAIPPVPELPLPLEAEALRAASSAARRGEPSSQPQPPQEASFAPQPTPIPAPPPPARLSAAPAPVPSAPAQIPAAPVKDTTMAPPPAPVPPPPAATPAPVVPPPAAPAPAAAWLSRAAMLSHAAATAARQAAAANQQPGQEKHEQASRVEAGQPPTAMASDAGPTLPAAPAQRTAEKPEQAASPPEATSPAHESTSSAPEPALPPIEAARPESAHIGAPPVPEAAGAPGEAPDEVADVDQPIVMQPAVGQRDADLDAAPSTPASAPSRPAHTAASDPGPIPAPPAPSGQARPTSPTLDDTATGAPTEPSPPLPAEPTPAPAAAAPPAASGQTSPDYAEGTADTAFVGISAPPSVAHPPAASAVPSWTPHQPVQSEPGFGVAQPVQPTPARAPGEAHYYAPYAASEAMSPDGVAEANGTGTATPLDLALAPPMPSEQPDLAPSSAVAALAGPQPPTDDISEGSGHLEADARGTTRRRRSTKRRLPTQKIFSDLATQAAIPAAAYAIGEDVDGAMCLVRTDEGFEVFNAAAGARHEVRIFQDEESAYFYLFGVLVAESVRTGALIPRG